MKNLIISTTMLKSSIVYASALAIAMTAFFATPSTASAATTYLLDLTGNGCGSRCAELQAYLDKLNVNSNSNSNSTSTNGTSTSTTNNGNGNGGSQVGQPVSYPNLGYQYSSSTLAYYQRNQQPATSSASTYAYPSYSYFRNPATTSSTGYNQYPTLQYVYNGSKASTAKAAASAYDPATSQAFAPKTQLAVPNPYYYAQMPAASSVQTGGFVITSGN